MYAFVHMYAYVFVYVYEYVFIFVYVSHLAICAAADEAHELVLSLQSPRDASDRADNVQDRVVKRLQESGVILPASASVAASHRKSIEDKRASAIKASQQRSNDDTEL
jgi:hypothetical protein